MKPHSENFLKRLLMLALAMLPTVWARADIADFDDLVLEPESHWSGPAGNGEEQEDPNVPGTNRLVGSFASGNVEFVNRYNLTYESWSGFAYSNTTDTQDGSYLNQYSAIPGSGHGAGNDNYGVAYGYRDLLDTGDAAQLAELPFFELPESARIESLRVTNTTYAALTMLNGDGYSKEFGGISGDEADWFKLTVYGTDSNGTLLADTVPLFLADYRFEDNSQDYILNEWLLLDLSPLADAQRIYFNLSSSDNGDFGMNTPAFFAVDDIQFSAVPEPPSIALFAIALLVVGMVRFFRRKYESKTFELLVTS